MYKILPIIMVTCTDNFALTPMDSAEMAIALVSTLVSFRWVFVCHVAIDGGTSAYQLGSSIQKSEAYI